MLLLFIGLGLLILTGKIKILTTKQIIETYKIEVFKYASLYDVEPSLVLAIIEQESSGNPVALGTSGEIGLGQITKFALLDFNRSTSFNYSKSDLFSIEKNINVTTWYISFLLHKFFIGDKFTSLRAYNAGIGNIRKSDTISVDYAKSVIERQAKIKHELFKQI